MNSSDKDNTQNLANDAPKSSVTVSNSVEGNVDSKKEEIDKKNVVSFANQSATEIVTPLGPCPKSTLHMLPKKVEMSIETFLGRPRIYSRHTWNAGHALGATLVSHNVPDAFLTSKQIFDKIANFRFLSADVHIRVLINANKFALGRLLVYAIPFPYPIPHGHLNTEDLKAIIQHSAYQSAYVDVGDNNSVELKFPFIYDRSAYDLLDPSSPPWVRFNIEVMNPYTSAEVDSAEVVTYMWMSNVALNVPIQRVADMQSEAIRQAASGVLDLADNVLATTHKVVDGLDRAFDSNEENLQWVKPLANLALSTFGFSKPLNSSLSTSMYQLPGRAFTSVDAEFPGTVLGATHTNQVLVEKCESATDVDEMDIATYCSRRALLRQFEWKKTDATGTVLFKWPVSPGMCLRNGLEYITSPLAFAASFFNHWRGGIKYQLSFVANQFYSGRVEFVFLSGVLPDDVPATMGIGSLEGAPRVVCDIKESTDCVFEIPFVSNYPWMRCFVLDPDDNVTIDYNNTLGSIAVVVHNALKAPPSVPTTIPVNIFVSGCEDIEFANPVSRCMLKGVAEMQSLPIDKARNREIPEPHHCLTDRNPLGMLPAKTAIGEKISNFRQLTRRLQMESYGLELNGTNLIEADPYYYGEDNVATNFTNQLFLIAHTFRFWKGSRRYMIQTFGAGNTAYQSISCTTVWNAYNDPPAPAHTSTTSSFFGSGFESINYTNINPMPCLVMPYYGYKSKVAVGTANGRNVLNIFTELNDDTIKMNVYTAAGDDWSAFARIAPPPIIMSSI